MLRQITQLFIKRAENRIDVKLDYAHEISKASFSLFYRYGKIFGFLDPNTKVPAIAYHTARLRGALGADCGTCVEAEINLAKSAKIDADQIEQIVSGQYDDLPNEIVAVAKLADAVTHGRQDDPEAREIIRVAFGNPGLIEIAYAMNGAALLPGIKRAMGYATACDINMLRKLTAKS